MTETERKALALVNEVNRLSCCHMREVGSVQAVNTLLRAIEQHEAFKQEVSDAVKARFIEFPNQYGCLDRFIIAKPDPLVEVMRDALSGIAGTYTYEELTPAIRAALAARGLKIVEDKNG